MMQTYVPLGGWMCVAIQREGASVGFTAQVRIIQAAIVARKGPDRTTKDIRRTPQPSPYAPFVFTSDARRAWRRDARTIDSAGPGRRADSPAPIHAPRSPERAHGDPQRRPRLADRRNRRLLSHWDTG